MTALTPQQMRELATRLDSVVRNEGLWGYEAEDVERAAAALRAAADQLEAVQAWNQRDRGMFASVALSRILTADTAPQDVS